jgi:hypothetical protein
MWIVLLLNSFLPHDKSVLDSVEIAELNHVICPTNGNEQGVYWVWWRWQVVDGVAGYYVADWRRHVDVPRPTDGIQQFWDSKTRVNRRIESKVFSETWTYYDRETEDRKRLPEYRRRKLQTEYRGEETEQESVDSRQSTGGSR